MNAFIKAGLLGTAVLWLGGGVAQAGVYRCEQNGVVTYADKPCAPDSKPAQLPPLERMAPAPGEAELAKQYEKETDQAAAKNRAENKAWVKEHEATKAREDAIRKAMVEGRVVKGMTPEQVERVLNEPLRIEDKGGPKERWIYVDSQRRRRVITFEDGVVVSVGKPTSKHN